MKILKVFKPNNEVEEYRLGEKAKTHPQEFVKDIIYKNGDFTITFSENGEWFKSFIQMPFEYTEFSEMKNKSNKDWFQGDNKLN